MCAARGCPVPGSVLAQSDREPEALRAARAELDKARENLAELFARDADEDDPIREARRLAQDRYGAAVQRVAELEAVWVGQPARSKVVGHEPRR